MTVVPSLQTSLADCVSACLDEALESVRTKDVRSTTLERLRLTWEADQRVQGLPQALQLGEGLNYLLEHISTPVALHDQLLGRITERVPDAEEEAFFQQTLRAWQGRAIPPWMPDGGHECLAWERLLRYGLNGLEERAQLRATTETGPQADFLGGAVRVYQALRHYLRRYAQAADEGGLTVAAKRCRAIAERPPATFAEALQLVWIVGHVYCTMVSINPTLTFGRMDELLGDYYRRDLVAGRLTRPEAAALITDFYAKNNLILGRGEHQMSGNSSLSTGWQRNLTYDAPQYIVLGGRRAVGTPPGHDLTELFLECVVPRFENPVVVVRYSPDLPESLWRLAVDKMRQNSSMLVYNDADVIPALERAGIAPQHALTYTMHGCNWPDVPGVQRAAGGNFLWLPRYLLEALLGTPEAPAPHYPTLDALYEGFRVVFRAALEAECARFRAARAAWAAKAPGALHVDDCFLAGPVERARSWSVGGVPYTTLTASLCSLATVADSLAAVEELVFRTRSVSLEDLGTALRADFAAAPSPQDARLGGEALRQACLNARKFGQDDERADSHAARLLRLLLDEIEAARRRGTPDEVLILPSLETDMNHIRAGQTTGATPDGRLAGQPLSENTSPSPGACTQGLTAMLRSLAKLPLNHIASGALNLRLSPRVVADAARLAALLRTYLDLGGLQVQLSVADAETLRQAQRTPEAYRDLMVRITGYSAVFIDMDVAAQNEIIRRAEMGLS